MKYNFEELKNIIDNLIELMDTNLDVNAMSLEEIKNRENEIITQPVTLFLSLLKENSLISAVIEDSDLPEIVNIKKISNNFLHLSYKVTSFIKKVEQYRDSLMQKDAVLDDAHEEVLSDKSLIMYQNTATLLNLLSPLFTYIDKVFAIGDNINDKPEYLRLISKYNKKYEKTLEALAIHSEKSGDEEIGNPYTYRSVLKLFTKRAKLLDPAFLIEEEQKPQSKPKKAMVESRPQIIDADIERRKMIKQVNEQFDRICYDYIPDYDKQIPYHLRKEYEHLRNVIFPQFIHEYKLPLHENTSSDIAKAALKGFSNKNKDGILDILEDLSERC